MFNGFTMNDLPFLMVQLLAGAIVTWMLRLVWLKRFSNDSNPLMQWIIPVNIVLTLLAVLSIKSPWIAVVFGLISLIIGLSKDLSLTSRVFYLLVVVLSFGCGIGYVIIFVLIYILLLFPLLLINGKK